MKSPFIRSIAIVLLGAMALPVFAQTNTPMARRAGKKTHTKAPAAQNQCLRNAEKQILADAKAALNDTLTNNKQLPAKTRSAADKKARSAYKATVSKIRKQFAHPSKKMVAACNGSQSGSSASPAVSSQSSLSTDPQK